MNGQVKIANLGTGFHSAFDSIISTHEREVISIRGNFNLAMIYDLDPESFLDLGRVLLNDLKNTIVELENCMVEAQETYTQVDLSNWDAQMVKIHTRMVAVEKVTIDLISNMELRIANSATEKETSDRWFLVGTLLVIVAAALIVMLGK